VPGLAMAARTVGSPQIRNAASIGGNLATCSPAGDGLPVLSALDAVVELEGPTGRRELPVGEFMTGVKRTARGPDELITTVTVPVLDGWQGYAKVGVRNAMVIAIAGACLAVDRPTRSVRLALGSVAPTIVRAEEAEAFVESHVEWATLALTEPAAQEFGRLAAAASRPIDDHRASAAYRRHAVEVLARRLIRRAFPHPAA
jgi:CO/xanthine dehydrogenase FAD-binding subunit